MLLGAPGLTTSNKDATKDSLQCFRLSIFRGLPFQQLRPTSSGCFRPFRSLGDSREHETSRLQRAPCPDLGELNSKGLSHES